MSNEIKFQKTTAYLIVGVLIALLVGGFLVFGASSNGQQANKVGKTCSAGDCTGNNAPTETQPSKSSPSDSTGNIQDIHLTASGYGYDPMQITVKKGIPVRLHFTANNAGCGSFLKIYGLNVQAISRGGEEAVVDFTPTQEGTYEYNCGMRMFRPGQFVVRA